ncbi:MAG: 4-hydroxy-3-methylbut-2-enyl diphosphate reductase [Kiritimatiellae bacterium]|nr:4-hydroxy-3-methylbut-2-enyl diphosphate reductase [Kiritimatiellia bacterium]
MKRLVVVKPHGFCSGVVRAVETARMVLVRHRGERIYCLHEIVHNEHVVDELSRAGMVFVKRVDEVPEGAILLFSAHGVAPEVRRAAEARRLRVVDATCPFVAKVHASVRRFASQGIPVICIGHRNHDEVVGVAGEAPDAVQIVEREADAETVAVPANGKVAVVTQTTLGAEQVDRVVAVLRRRFPDLDVPEGTDVCYATRNRQRAVLELARRCGRVLVLGSANSSNSQRLVETARTAGTEAHLIRVCGDLATLDWSGCETVGITSGASTPEPFLSDVKRYLQEREGFPEAEELVVAVEDPHLFRLPVCL